MGKRQSLSTKKQQIKIECQIAGAPTDEIGLSLVTVDKGEMIAFLGLHFDEKTLSLFKDWHEQDVKVQLTLEAT